MIETIAVALLGANLLTAAIIAVQLARIVNRLLTTRDRIVDRLDGLITMLDARLPPEKD